MKHMKLSVKLIGGFVIVAIIAAIIGGVGYWSLAVAKKAQNEVARNRLPSVYGLQSLNEAQSAIQGYERTIVYEKDPEILKRQEANLEDAWKRADKGWKIYEPLPQTEEETMMWKTFVDDWNAWKKSHHEVIALVKKGDHDAARTLSYGQTRDAYNKCAPELDKLVALNVKIAKDSNQAFDSYITRITAVFTGLIILGLAVSLSLGIYMSLSITKGMNRIISGLTEAAEQVSSAAGQVSSASQSLAEGSSEQAASVEETSSSLEEMSSMTKQNATNAGQADSLMKQANQVVIKANTSMTQLTTSMQEISKASEETSKIIKTIDEIAFQTNLLALNAAVEAARAGEAGAGFAVVADEVRNLAMRAADAAKNTAVLIEGTVKKIGDGSTLVKTTNDAFNEVSQNAVKVGELVAEIAAASGEQAQGIDQISIAVTEMDKVTQQNAATAEESASASEELSAQSEEMKGFVNRLAAIVGGNAAAAAPSGRTRTARRPSPMGHALQPSRKQQALPSGKNRAVKVKALPVRAPREANPNDIIPMDENDFKDF